MRERERETIVKMLLFFVVECVRYIMDIDDGAGGGGCGKDRPGWLENRTSFGNTLEAIVYSCEQI
jgi:hypothetical protein